MRVVFGPLGYLRRLPGAPPSLRASVGEGGSLLKRHIARRSVIIERADGDASQIAQNHLMMTHENRKSFVVSKRALQEVISREKKAT